jgi:hypothetical protein
MIVPDDFSRPWPEFHQAHFGTVRFLRFMDVTVDKTGPGTATLSLPPSPTIPIPTASPMAASRRFWWTWRRGWPCAP